jgi:hypothetical protein
VRSAETIEQDARAWELRVEHLTYQQIGGELGITNEGVRQAVERHARTIPAEAVADVKQIVLEELDVMSRHLLEGIDRDHLRITQSGRVVMHEGEPVLDHGPAIRAIAQLLRVQERKARLVGLDAPTRRAVDVITHDMFIEAIADPEADEARVEAELGAATP